MKKNIRITWALLSALLLCITAPAQQNTITLDMGEGKEAAIYYESYGEGTAIVILHRSSAGYLEPIFSEYDDYRRIYIDPPGIGNSPAEDWMQTSDDICEVVLRVIGHILPGEDFAIGGFSYFGYMARAVAEGDPERINGLLLMCPVSEPDYAKRDLPAHQKTYTDSAFYKSLSREQQDKLSRLVIRTEESYRNLSRYHDTTVKLDTALYNRIKRNNYAITQLNKPAVVEAPVLLLLGLQDNVVGYRDALPLLDRYPSVSLVIADYASHAFPFEQFELLKLNVELWLERMEIYREVKEEG